MHPLLQLKEIECRYQNNTVINKLSLHVNQGSLVCLLGSSGCGKTTVLRAIAGFEPIYHGKITMGDKLLSKPGFREPPEKRKLGMVFQDYALFPHMTISQNVSFGLKNKSPAENREIVARLLKLVGIDGFEKRFPHELSGGQQQRVALARALAPQPDIILMDEPFSNLDVDLRERLSIEIKDILKKEGITGILVTHHQDEAFALSDQIGVMNEGKILQWDTASNIYHEPANRFVANFIGQGVFLNGTMLEPNRIETEFGILTGDRAYKWSKGERVELLIRPDDVIPDPQSPIKGEITNKAFKGAEILYTLNLPTGSKVLSLFSSHQDHAIGEKVGISLNMPHVVAFPVT